MPKKISPLTEIVNRIHAHLKRIEADPVLNPDPGGKCWIWTPCAYQAGSKIGVRYINYQGATYLSKTEAETYLAWLDAGNNGPHYSQQRAAREVKQP